MRSNTTPWSDLEQTLPTPKASPMNYKVLVRCRPLSEKELEECDPTKRQKVVRKHDNTLYLYEPDASISVPLKFDFERVFLETDRNVEVYKTLGDSVDSFLAGFNTSILAYGVTGAGKSHTMFGSQYCEQYQEEGVVSLVVREVLGRMGAADSLSMSFMELYNEQLRDLLVEKSESLGILEDSAKCTSVPELTQHQVPTYECFLGLLRVGCSRRAVASTSSNTNSSRSHSIIQMVYTQARDAETVESKLFLVDLAGSERAAQSKGPRLQEGSNINRSLLALGNCITSLGEERRAFVPYRDSKLTRLLKDSLGGNSKTVLIVCISPSFASYEETLHALKYASRALKIRREVTPNVKSHESELDYLRREVARLRVLLSEKENTPNDARLQGASPKFALSAPDRRLEREVDSMKKALVNKDLQLLEKDETIRRLERELQKAAKSRSKSPLQRHSKTLRDNAKESDPRTEAQHAEPSTPTLSCHRPKTSGRCLPSTSKHEVVSLEVARERSRVFKHALRRLYAQYEQLDGQRMPTEMVDRINALAAEHAKGHILLGEEYANMLAEFRNLVRLCQ